ncbi:Crp/Fnr family transcriptional regulator [Sphingobium phenoxybenzoativorans]|uniref:Crp/Fnr family transcriptional regulator n=1 Tax=Sphingobium phenoxybenzoativorans TaxID=1592790 RepID=A0A975K5D4_9SPHN|nr:Crp/Fnr family transcriptional regulator [Sphingobium phenoxybenzoativorans]QUT05114.1 Crp/Fnr family transcriptional regulator [Sphingobium phenoxybenzoativorans]
MLLDDFLRGRRRDRLSHDDLEILEASVSHVKDLNARSTLISKGEPVQFSTYLIDGFMCRYMDDRDGERQLVAVHVAGDFVDLHGYPLERLDHDIATLTACRVALVPRDRINWIMEERSILAKQLWFSTLLDAAMHREWIFRLGRLDAVSRVGHFFCEMEAKLRAVGRSDGQMFTLPMTQPDLGEACGMTSVHMNRMLRELKERRLMSFAAGKVIMHDRAALAKLSEFDPSYLFIESAA